MSDPVAFLAARLDEDEAMALGVSEGPRKPEEWVSRQWQWGKPPRDWAVDCPHGALVVDGSFQAAAEHIARHDPARVLREVAAKRALIERYEKAVAAVAARSFSSFIRGQDDGYAQACLDAIRDANAAWSVHPDYDQEWK